MTRCNLPISRIPWLALALVFFWTLGAAAAGDAPGDWIARYRAAADQVGEMVPVAIVSDGKSIRPWIGVTTEPEFDHVNARFWLGLGA